MDERRKTQHPTGKPGDAEWLQQSSYQSCRYHFSILISLSFLRSNIECSFNISRKKQPYRSNIKSLVGRPPLVAVSVITAAKAEVTWSTIKNKKEAAVHVQCKTKSQKWSLISNNLVWPQTTMFFASPEDLYRTGWPKILNVLLMSPCSVNEICDEKFLSTKFRGSLIPGLCQLTCWYSVFLWL